MKRYVANSYLIIKCQSNMKITLSKLNLDMPQLKPSEAAARLHMYYEWIEMFDVDKKDIQNLLKYLGM